MFQACQQREGKLIGRSLSKGVEFQLDTLSESNKDGFVIRSIVQSGEEGEEGTTGE
jgi:hypothetical protein